MTIFYRTRQDLDPSSGFLLSLQILMWTTFTLAFVALLVVFMIT
jgi:hypothetical protein